MSADAKTFLVTKFDSRHVDAALGHFTAALDKYLEEDWDGVALKAGKFVEAITKALMLFCEISLPENIRHFKAGSELRKLEQRPGYPDTIRIVIPKACIFIYEIVNNRGGRHDAGEIDANGIDAKVIVPQIQWILAELVRFCSVGRDINAAAKLIDGITNRVYSMFEKIGNRTYVNAAEAGAPMVAILLAYDVYPGAIHKRDLETAIMRHGFTASVANKAINRNMNLFDNLNGALTLRATGRTRAEEFLKTTNPVT
jgi:hypothetical protein